jgi:hypothetical protein
VNEQRIKKEASRGRSWLDYLAVEITFLAAIVAFFGALVTYYAEAQIPEASLWPLPGLVLFDWVLLALIGFIITYFCFQQSSTKWLYVAWFITGTFIPLSILGAPSIGLGVLITLFMFVVTTIFFTIRQAGKLLQSFGLLMLGSICNLGVLSLVITLGTLNKVR